MDKQKAIKEILNHIYLNGGNIPLLNDNSEKLKILHELYRNGVIWEADITTTSSPANPYDNPVVTKNKGYSINRELARRLYGINIPS